MDLLWGTQGPIALEDPLYDIFMHVMANGSMSVSVENSRKFMLKIVGFRDHFTPDDLIAKFRGIISSHVKDCISKIMINGMLSYFMMNAHLFELSGVIKERLDKAGYPRTGSACLSAERLSVYTYRFTGCGRTGI